MCARENIILIIRNNSTRLLIQDNNNNNNHINNNNNMELDYGDLNNLLRNTSNVIIHFVKHVFYEVFRWNIKRKKIQNYHIERVLFFSSRFQRRTLVEEKNQIGRQRQRKRSDTKVRVFVMTSQSVRVRNRHSEICSKSVFLSNIKVLDFENRLKNI